MCRIDVAALAFTIGRLIAQPFQMLRLGFGNALGLLLPLGQRLFIDIELDRREGLKKRIDHTRVDRIGRNILTHRGPILLPQIVTDVAGAPLILHDHFMTAFAAVDQAVQQGFARTGNATGFVAVILGVIVFQWSRQKSGGDSAVSSEFVIAGMIFHPSRIKSQLLYKYIEQAFVELTLLPTCHREDVWLLVLLQTQVRSAH
jgi:hypothetical protein